MCFVFYFIAEIICLNFAFVHVVNSQRIASAHGRSLTDFVQISPILGNDRVFSIDPKCCAIVVHDRK